VKICGKCKIRKSLENFCISSKRKDGHDWACKECKKEYRRIYLKNPEKLQRKREMERKYSHLPQVIKHKQEYALNYYYGITSRQREDIWIEQYKKCAICKKQINTWKQSRVDHNHQTKKVRGILCNDCNLLLGHAFDSPEILQAAISYLQQY